MQSHPEPSMQELLWTVAASRVLFGPSMNIQVRRWEGRKEGEKEGEREASEKGREACRKEDGE
jgi:hypothetical protein